MVIEAMKNFLDDNTLDLPELERIMEIALRDGQVDEHEKRVLKSIFSKVDQTDVSEEVWQEIQNIRTTYEIG